MGGRSVHLYHILDEAPNIPLQLVTWMETSTWSLRMKSSSLLWINGPNSRLDRAKCLPLLKLTTRLRNLMCAQREVVRYTVPKHLPTSSKTPSPCSWNTTNTCIFSGAFPNYGSPRLRRLLGLETQSSVTDAPYLSKRHS